MPYSIIIPVYNEVDKLKTLLNELEEYSINGHQILIVNDGSNDGSINILKENLFINLINLKRNYGKGIALKVGIFKSKNKKIIIFDGDLELKTKNIYRLMKLDKTNGIHCQMGNRFNSLNPIKSSHDWGNFIFTVYFNFFNSTNHKDILCCAKSFYKTDIQIKYLKSTGFDIDLELSSYLSINSRGKRIDQVFLNYKRRSINEGKKLRISDGWKILKRLLVVC